MIKLIPSLTVMGGKSVRIVRGNYNDLTVYENTPLESAIKFEEHGLTHLHLVDLDGSRRRSVANYDTLEMIANYTNLTVDFGGGIETDGDISKSFEYGAKIINVGNIAATNRDLFASWIMSYGRKRVILSADAFDDKLMIRGQDKPSDIDLMDFIAYFYERSLLYLKCADVQKSGALEGPNFDLYKKLLKRFPELKIMAGGGVTTVDDIKALEDLGVWGVIFGRAYYAGKMNLKSLEGFIANQPAD